MFREQRRHVKSWSLYSLTFSWKIFLQKNISIVFVSDEIKNTEFMVQMVLKLQTTNFSKKNVYIYISNFCKWDRSELVNTIFRKFRVIFSLVSIVQNIQIWLLRILIITQNYSPEIIGIPKIALTILMKLISGKSRKTEGLTLK